MKRSNKLLTIISTAICLFGVFVAGVATMAWFQLDVQPIQTSAIMASPSISFDQTQVKGHKISHTLGPDGFIDYSSNTVTTRKGEDTDTSNNNQASADTRFDIPQDGLGYYLVKKNAGDSYKYIYNDIVYSWKFKELDNSSINYSVINTLTVATTDSFIVRNYSYDSSDYKTVNEKVKISKDKGNFTVSDTGDYPTYEITPTTAGTYKVWFNRNTNKVSFESIENVANINRTVNAANISIKATETNTKSNIDTGTWFDSIGFEQATTNSSNADWFIQTWGGGATDTGYPGLKFLNDSSGAQSPIWFTRTSAYQKFTGFQITRWENNGDSSTIGTNVSGWGGSANNTWKEESVTANKYNYFKVSNWNMSKEWRSKLKVYYVKDGVSTLSSTQYVWNKNSVSSTLTDAGVYSPSEPGYTFNGWYKNSSCTTAFTDGYISHDTSIYAKFTKIPDPSSTKYTVNLYLNGNTNWSTVYCYAYGGSGIYPTETSWSNAGTSGSDVIVSGQTYKKYTFQISVSYPNIIFNNGSTGGTNQSIDLTNASSHGGQIYVFTGQDNSGKWQGSWYGSVSGVSTTLKDYYIYDQAEYLSENSGTPKVYVWKNNVTGTGSNTFYIPHNSANAAENAAWPGTTLLTTDADGSTSLPSHMYRFRVSETYDSFVLNNGKTKGSSGAFQTQDLTGASGLSGHGMTSGAARTSSTYYFVFSGKTPMAGGTYYQVNGDWIQNIGTISLKVAFAIYDGTTYTHLSTLNAGVARNGEYDIKNDFYVSTVTYKPTITSKSSINSGNDFIIGDGTNGIVYDFSIPNGTLTWYKDTSWSETYDAVNGETGYSGDLYVRAVCDIRQYISIYVDDAAWSNGYLAVKTSGNTDTYFTATSESNWMVATGLYKVTLRNDWMIQLSSGSNPGYNLGNISGGVPNMGSGDAAYYRVNTSTSKTYDYLFISSSGSGSSWSWVDYKPVSSSNVYIQKKVNGGWVNVVEMKQGDGTGNDYILESGQQFSVNDLIRVYDNNSLTAYGYSRYVDGNISKHPYIASGDDGGGIILSEFTDTARFNFYITHNDNPSSRRLSIAMVPDYGNGFYIMNYDTTMSTSTDHYIGAVKMDSADYSASYVGYYATNGSKIFVRSYLNAVDTLATTLTAASSEYATISDGIITFKKTAKFNISVNNTTVDISEYHVSDFFKLNPVNPGADADTAAEIYAQKTTLIYEIPVTVNNSYSSNISLMFVGGVSYIGASLYVNTTSLGTGAEAYNFLRGALSPSSYYTGMTATNSSTAIADKHNLTIAAGSTTVYVYVMIDYLPGVTAANIASTTNLTIYLLSNQI